METKDLIKAKRIENGMTMKQLAEKVGVSEATISRWESGNIATMKQTKIAALAKALDISPALLVTGECETVKNNLINTENSKIPVLDDPDIRMIARKSLNNDPKKAQKLKQVIELILSDDEDDD